MKPMSAIQGVHLYHHNFFLSHYSKSPYRWVSDAVSKLCIKKSQFLYVFHII